MTHRYPKRELLDLIEKYRLLLPIDVRDHGAKLDGKVDDRQAIQSALVQGMTDKRDVFLPPTGVALINSGPLEFKRDMTFIGQNNLNFGSRIQFADGSYLAVDGDLNGSEYNGWAFRNRISKMMLLQTGTDHADQVILLNKNYNTWLESLWLFDYKSPIGIKHSSGNTSRMYDIICYGDTTDGTALQFLNGTVEVHGFDLEHNGVGVDFQKGGVKIFGGYIERTTTDFLCRNGLTRNYEIREDYLDVFGVDGTAVGAAVFARLEDCHDCNFYGINPFMSSQGNRSSAIVINSTSARLDNVNFYGVPLDKLTIDQSGRNKIGIHGNAVGTITY